ncbi:c-type cytochrome [Pontibacter liquoris]|uniref:c-type cytochrome n=1 Tax=Pontibacter liquoris TaxID=2905677 RepID=UPI001FA7A2D9|nr:cytochrome c [Pontibacter liquoris]
MKRFTIIGFKASAVLFATASLVACGSDDGRGVEYAPDMYHSIPLDPYSQIKEEKYNPYGMNMRQPAYGTIARGKEGYNMYLSQDTAEVAGVELTNPLPHTEENLAKGKVLYSRFCQHCHGEQGDGQGLVGQKFKGVPSYSAGRVASLPAGHIFHVITNGRGRMRPHGSLVNPTERWEIVMYVQQLQKGITDTAAPADKQAADEAGGTPGTDNPVTGTPPAEAAPQK